MIKWEIQVSLFFPQWEKRINMNLPIRRLVDSSQWPFGRISMSIKC